MKKISVILEITLSDGVDIDYGILELKKKLDGTILKADGYKPNIIAWSDKVSFLEQIKQADKFKSYLELHKSVLYEGIHMFNSNTSIPSSLGTDFSLGKIDITDLEEIEDHDH